MSVEPFHDVFGSKVFIGSGKWGWIFYQTKLKVFGRFFFALWNDHHHVSWQRIGPSKRRCFHPFDYQLWNRLGAVSLQKVGDAPVTMFCILEPILGVKNCNFYIPWFPIAVQFAVCITRKRRLSVKIFIFVLKESSGLEWNAKTGRKETNEGKQQHDAKALPYKPKPSSVI